MKVIHCKVGQNPNLIEIDGSLKSMQVLVMNEEGKLQNLPPHRFIANGRDIICGDFFVAAFGKNEDGEDDIVGLTDEQAALVKRTIEIGRFC